MWLIVYGLGYEERRAARILVLNRRVSHRSCGWPNLDLALCCFREGRGGVDALCEWPNWH